MYAKPITNRCAILFNSKAHICLGISPFNSYFSESRIEALIRWGKQNFDSLHLFVPDAPTAFTLEAIGYDKEKAAWKARRQCQYLRNKIHRALKNVGYTDSEASAMYLGWDVLSNNPRYIELHTLACSLFESNGSFRAACIEGSRWVLENKVADCSALTEQALLFAVRYLLAELPLFVDSAGIIGKPASVFAYHQRVDFIEKLFQRRLPFPISDQQGFVVLETSTSDEATHQYTELVQTAKSLTY